MIALAGAGCASAPAPPEGGAQFRRTTSVPKCVSFGAHHRWPGDDVNVRLQPELEAALLEQLVQQPLEQPFCWYQIPSGDLLLRAGDYCGMSREAQFHQDGSKWTLVRLQPTLGQCGTTR